MCIVEKLPQELSHKPHLHSGNRHQKETFTEIPWGPMQVEKSARTVISKYNLHAFLALTLMLQVKIALTDGHVVHINMKLAGSQRPELSQQKKHIKLKKLIKKLTCKRQLTESSNSSTVMELYIFIITEGLYSCGES